ncbi:hypothetical protein [Muricomes intestini]|nr:hypothetical protein [Muricomes intestini]
MIKGCTISETSLREALKDTDISLHFDRLEEDAFIKLMLEQRLFC